MFLTQIFDGNIDQDTVVYHALNPPITARYIRFKPVDKYGHVSMRVELYGCLPGTLKKTEKMCKIPTKREIHSRFFFNFYGVHLSFFVLKDKI